MPTTTELAKRVMKRAGKLDPTQSPTAAEAADIVAVMNSVYESYKERGMVNWTLTEIPVMYQDAFINIVALRIGADFGGVTQEMIELSRIGMREIEALSERKIDPRETSPVDY